MLKGFPRYRSYKLFDILASKNSAVKDTNFLMMQMHKDNIAGNSGMQNGSCKNAYFK